MNHEMYMHLCLLAPQVYLCSTSLKSSCYVYSPLIMLIASDSHLFIFYTHHCGWQAVVCPSKYINTGSLVFLLLIQITLVDIDVSEFNIYCADSPERNMKLGVLGRATSKMYEMHGMYLNSLSQSIQSLISSY